MSSLKFIALLLIGLLYINSVYGQDSSPEVTEFEVTDSIEPTDSIEDESIEETEVESIEETEVESVEETEVESVEETEVESAEEDDDESAESDDDTDDASGDDDDDTEVEDEDDDDIVAGETEEGVGADDSSVEGAVRNGQNSLGLKRAGLYQNGSSDSSGAMIAVVVTIMVVLGVLVVAGLAYFYKKQKWDDSKDKLTNIQMMDVKVEQTEDSPVTKGDGNTPSSEYDQVLNQAVSSDDNDNDKEDVDFLADDNMEKTRIIVA